MPSSLVLKDTSGKSVYPVFTADAGTGIEGLGGAGDIVLVPDPKSFRVLPWAPNTGWVLCDLHFPDGRPVPFSTRRIFREALDRLAARGYGVTIGVELEFHVFRALGVSDRAVTAKTGAFIAEIDQSDGSGAADAGPAAGRGGGRGADAARWRSTRSTPAEDWQSAWRETEAERRAQSPWAASQEVA